jgi:hypothetical protein
MPIRKNASMDRYIKDFEKSDAPQFKGKSKDKRAEMAVAAKLQAMGNKMEEGSELAEKKGTLCGRCGHVHVKGTPCPRPFKEGVKPDFLDLDKDGNKTEPMEKAAKDAKAKHEVVRKVLGRLKEAGSMSPEDKKANDLEIQAQKAKIAAAQDRISSLQKVTEAKHPIFEAREYDYEGEMARTQLISIVKNAKSLFDSIGEKTQLQSWVQSKLTKAEDYLNAVRSYLDGESISNTAPLMVNNEPAKDDEGTALSVGDVVRGADGRIYQAVHSYSEGKPFLTPFDLKKRKTTNLSQRHYFDAVTEDEMSPTMKMYKVMPHTQTKGGFTK